MSNKVQQAKAGVIGSKLDGMVVDEERKPRKEDETMKYYTTEKNDNASHRDWEATSATTLAGAKAVARKRQMFHGTVCAVGIGYDHGIEQVAYTRNGTWHDN